MADTVHDPALSAILGSEAEEASAAQDGHASQAPPLPSLDRRVELFMRAVYGPGHGATVIEREGARRRILDAMAADMAAGGARRPRTTARTTLRREADGWATRLGNFLLAPLLSSFGGRLVAASVATVAIVAVGWSAAWFYAEHTTATAIAAWVDREAKSGRSYACASQAIGGFPWRLEMSCTDPKLTMADAGVTRVVHAKDLHVTASVLRPNQLVASLAGPLAIDDANHATSLVGNWTSAQGTLQGPLSSPAGASIELKDVQFYRVAQANMSPLLSGERIELRAHPAPGADSASAISILAEVTGGSIPGAGALPSQPMAIEVAAIVHDTAGSGPKSLADRARDWQRAGGRVEVANARVQQGESVAVATGSIGLTASGRLDGGLQVSLAGPYVQLAQAALENQKSAADDRDRIADSVFGTRSMGNAEHERELEEQQRRAREAARRNQAAVPSEVPIRLVDGAIYFGNVLVATIPPFF